MAVGYPMPYDNGFWTSTADNAPCPDCGYGESDCVCDEEQPLTPENAPQEFCRVCQVWLGSDEFDDGICFACRADEEPSDDFPLSLEYEGAYGLSGYDSYYDNDSDLAYEY